MSLDLRLGRWQDVLADVEAVDAVITGYDPIDEEWCRDFVRSWAPRNRGWFFIFGDHITNRWWEAALDDAGLYVFPPVVWAKTGAAPRMSCDGPASHCEYAAVARPKRKKFLTWGSLRGWYIAETVRYGHGHHGVSGAKPLSLMRAIVRDYSRPGDLIVDPCAGGATTLLAAAIEGRNAIGAEMDPETYRRARARIEGGYRPEDARKGEQIGLLAGGKG